MVPFQQDVKTSRSDESHGLRGTGGGRDDVDGGGVATFPILLGRIVHGLLRGGIGGKTGGKVALFNEGTEDKAADAAESVFP